MYRRDALRRIAAVGVAASLAGCSSDASTSRDLPGPPEPPESGPPGESEGSDESFAVAGIDYRADDAGNLVVIVTVKNGGSQSESGTLTTTVTLGGETLSESVDVTIEAEESTAVEVAFEASFENFEQNGKIDLELE